MDSGGNAFAVWVKNKAQGCGPSDVTCSGQIWANRFRPAAGWGPPVVIGEWSGPIYQFPLPEVAVGLAGNAVVAWSANGSVWASSFRSDYGWGLATPLSRGSGSVSPFSFGGPVSVIVDGTGGATVLWDEYDGTQWSVWTDYFVPVSGWHQPVSLASNASSPHVAADDAGESIVAVWAQQGPGLLSSMYGAAQAIGASWFVPGQGWGAPATLKAESPNGVVSQPKVGLAANGTAVVTWVGGDLDSYNSSLWNLTLWGDSMAPGGSWAKPSALGAPVYGFGRFSNAVDKTGTATAAFCTRGGYGDCADVWSARFNPDTGWQVSSPAREFVDYTTLMYGLGVAVDGSGKSTFAWSEYNYGASTVGIWTRRLDFIHGWETPVQVSSSAGWAVPEIAVDPSGDAVLVWIQQDGNRSAVYSSVSGSFVDFTPPSLSLSSPEDGSTTSEPLVTVEGRTEPGATLVVNGILVAVSLNGSFRVMVALTEGTNAIRAAATDAAGNTATASVSVLYLNPIPPLNQRLQDVSTALADALQSLASAYTEILLLFALQAVFIASTVFFFVKYWKTRGGKTGPTPDDAPRNGPDAAQDARREDGEDSATVSKTMPPSNQVLDRPWPEVPEGSPVYLPAKERVVLHLLDYAKYADASEVPSELTQEGIANGAGFERRHFAQYVRPLVRDGLIEERLAHVEGTLQKRKVYVLTYEGWRRALAVRTRVQSVEVMVREGSDVRVATIGDLMGTGRDLRSVLDVVRESIESGRVGA